MLPKLMALLRLHLVRWSLSTASNEAGSCFLLVSTTLIAWTSCLYVSMSTLSESSLVCLSTHSTHAGISMASSFPPILHHFHILPKSKILPWLAKAPFLWNFWPHWPLLCLPPLTLCSPIFHFTEHSVSSSLRLSHISSTRSGKPLFLTIPTHFSELLPQRSLLQPLSALIVVIAICE